MSLLKTMDEILELEAKATPGPWEKIVIGNNISVRKPIIEPDREVQDAELETYSRNHIKQMALALKWATEKWPHDFDHYSHMGHLPKECRRCDWDKEFTTI